MTLTPLLVGLRAAWRTPSIIARDFAVLLAPPSASPEGAAGGRAEIAVLVAHRALALLARMRPSRWRATCLHRSVAECVALRAYGLPARVVIGVGNGAAPATTIAHAWVECEGVRCRSTRGAAELEMLASARGTSPRARTEHALLHDDALVVQSEAALVGLVSPWLPLHAAPPTGQMPRATIDVVAVGDVTSVDAALLLSFGGVQVHTSGDDVLHLVGRSAARGRIDLAAPCATISAPPVLASAELSDSPLAFDVYSMLTLSAAFLVGRLGGALVHAGGVVDPEGRAWLLVGDTHAGKTTTCVSLVSAGWRFLADDQVVLRFGSDGALVAEGWPRRAHLDEGFGDAVVTGTRATVDLRTQWSDRWQSRAPLGGVLIPAVNADQPTSLAAAADAAAFAALVRQSPWLMADRAMAGDVMKLLRDAASHPTFALSLGRDSYARGDVLAERLAPARAAGAPR